MIKRTCKAHNMSYSMIRSCMKDYGLVYLFESSSTCSSWKQWGAYHRIKNYYLTSRSFSGRVNSEKDRISERDMMGMDKSIGSEKRYQMMLENLKAESSKPEVNKIILNAIGKVKKNNRKESKDGVLHDTVPPVILAIVPSLFLTKYHFYSRKSVNPDYFLDVRQPMKTSMSYDRLCLQLNVPYQLGEGFQGPKALIKLCAATRPGDSIYSYCAENIPAINEVFKVAAYNVSVADKQDLMNLLYYRYIVRDFSTECYKTMFLTFVQTMRDGRIKITDLIEFIKRFQECDTSVFTESEKKDFDVLRKCICYHFVTESSRTSGIFKHVYSVIPTKYDSIFLLLNKVLMKNLDKIDVPEAILIHKEIHNKASSTVVKKLSSWISKNFDKVTLTDIEKMMPGLIESDYRNDMLLELFDKVLISTPIKSISITGLMQILSYCTIAQFYNDSVLEAACDHYIEDQVGYNTQQLHILLKAVGTLNFTPEKSADFFTKVELQLINNFYNINALAFLEMVVYLIYVDRFSLNLMDHIFRDQFLDSISGMKKEERVLAERCFRIIDRESSLISETKQITLPEDPTLQWRNNDSSPYDKILPVFAGILKEEGQVNVCCKPTGSGTYLEMTFDDIANSLGRKSNYPDDKLAFMVLTEDSFCKNKGFTQHMMGEEMANIRLLQEEGVTVVWVPGDKVKELQAQKSLSAFARKLMLKVIKSG